VKRLLIEGQPVENVVNGLIAKLGTFDSGPGGAVA
jgi:hypothetical protein